MLHVCRSITNNERKVKSKRVNKNAQTHKYLHSHTNISTRMNTLCQQKLTALSTLATPGNVKLSVIYAGVAIAANVINQNARQHRNNIYRMGVLHEIEFCSVYYLTFS
jgi:hypothetical protein